MPVAVAVGARVQNVSPVHFGIQADDPRTPARNDEKRAQTGWNRHKRDGHRERRVFDCVPCVTMLRLDLTQHHVDHRGVTKIDFGIIT